MTNPLTREDVAELRAAIDAATEGHDSLGPVGMVIHITPAGKAKLTAALALASQSLSREAEIRREVIEECAKAAESFLTKWRVADHLIDSAGAYIRLLALAQQPDKEPG